MGSVFVSHSKADTHLRKYFAEIFSHIGLQAKYMEWYDFGNKDKGYEISQIIRSGIFSGHDVEAVIVLLGENVLNPPTNTPEFTHNWVTFEVGAAAGCLKQVWVFEEFNKFIKFPIPFVTDYGQYVLDNPEHLKYYAGIFKDRIMYKNNTIKPVKEVECKWADCNARFRLWSESPSIYCPVCRRETYGDVPDNVTYAKILPLKP